MSFPPLAFIDKTDYASYIRNNILDQVTQMDDELLDKAEVRAIRKVKSYLKSRFNVETIFSQTGDDRDEMVVECCINIALYNLHALINPRKIPDFRKDLKNDSMDWLKAVQKGEVEPDSLPRLESPDGDTIKFGSNTKRDNRL